MSLRIRPISQNDKTIWLELFKEYIDFYKAELSNEQYELTWQRINSEYNMHGLLAEKDGQIIGLAHYIFRPDTWEVADFCYLEDLYVDPKARGVGIGRALIKSVEQIAIEKGSKRLYWTTAEDNEVARKLYDKLAVVDKVMYKIYLNQ
ncbi:MAG: GNAT family N-acetyltransferase [Actinobacteria bacterium]|nr:GNAT family N-acetyltransferase [Actinomycetota bacterium]